MKRQAEGDVTLLTSWGGRGREDGENDEEQQLREQETASLIDAGNLIWYKEN